MISLSIRGQRQVSEMIMNGFFWLIAEMSLLLLAAAMVFFGLGWFVRERRAHRAMEELKARWDAEARISAWAPAQVGLAGMSEEDEESEELKRELGEALARQQQLERELLRLNDTNRELNDELMILKPKAALEKVARDATPLVAKPVPDANEVDDLTRIRGLGAVFNTRLRAAGITSYRQIALWKSEDMVEWNRQLRLGGRAERDRWREQAAALHLEKHGEILL